MPDVDRLYAVPLEDFVAERKRLAKELRDGGDREAATAVAKLPKPTAPAWALNQLAREEPDAVAGWLEAAEVLRDASANPGAGLRDAMAEHRDATRRLLATVRERARPGGRPLSEPMVERVRELLTAATADAEQADALRRGTVVEGEDDAADALPEAASAPSAPRASKPASKPAPAPARSRTGERDAEERARRREEQRAERGREAERRAAEKAARRAELERHVDTAERELERLRDEAAERKTAAETADERLAEARRTLHRSESEASAAHAAAKDARSAAEAAERELKQLARQLRSAS